MSNIFFGGSEILQIADAIAKDKNVERDDILLALEDAMRVAARKKYGSEISIRVDIDRRNGEIKFFHDMLVVEDLEQELPEEFEYLNKVLLSEATFTHPDCAVGDVVSTPLPPVDIARVAAQAAKHVMSTRLREIVRNREYNEFILRKHEIVSGIVDKNDRGNLIVRIGNTEASISRFDLLRTDNFKNGDRIKAVLIDVIRDNKNAQLRLSRTDNLFLAKLFEQEVPEVYDKQIEVKSVARDPSSRAKVAVYTRDSAIDAVGSCVGIRGARIIAITNELNGEKIDVIEWTEDPAALAIKALAPAEVSKVIIDEDRHSIEVVIPEASLSLAIGRKGQNIRLASQLVKWNLTLISEQDESKRRSEEFSNATELFMRHLDLEELLAQLLVSEGFATIADLAHADPQSVAAIEGLDVDIAEELIERAKDYLVHNPEPEQKTSLYQFLKNPELAHSLENAGIKTVDELADLSRDEFMELIRRPRLKEEEIDSIILSSREFCGYTPPRDTEEESSASEAELTENR